MRSSLQKALLMIRILQVIRARTIESPIKCQTIASMFGISIRLVTEFVEQIKNAGEWICSTQKKPYGYYYASSKAELEDYLLKEYGRIVVQLQTHRRQRSFIPPTPELFETDYLQETHEQP